MVAQAAHLQALAVLRSLVALPVACPAVPLRLRLVVVLLAVPLVACRLRHWVSN